MPRLRQRSSSPHVIPNFLRNGLMRRASRCSRTRRALRHWVVTTEHAALYRLGGLGAQPLLHRWVLCLEDQRGAGELKLVENSPHDVGFAHVKPSRPNRAKQCIDEGATLRLLYDEERDAQREQRVE